jgi:SulP family sulfate permease
MKLQTPVLAVMKSTGFYDQLGSDHFLEEEKAISHLFYKVLDPAICIYECEVRAFIECQNLPKRSVPHPVSVQPVMPADKVPEISAQDLWQTLHNGTTSPLIIDVRESREYRRGHIPQAKLNSLPHLFSNPESLPPPDNGQKVILVCRSGRRSRRAAQILQDRGYSNVMIVQGGMLAWKNAGLLEAVEIGSGGVATEQPPSDSTAPSNRNGC